MAELVETRDRSGRGYFVRLPIGVAGVGDLSLVFVPAGFTIRPTVDLIVHFHGLAGRIRDVRDYFSDPARAGLWAGLAGAGKKSVVLAAPSLGENPERGSDLTGRRAALADYVDAVLGVLAEHGPHAPPDGSPGTRPALGSLVLSGHSAGGSPLLLASGQPHRYQASHRESWCFDGWYYGAAGWLKWLRDNPSKQLRGYYTRPAKSEATAKEVAAAGLPNATVEPDPGNNHPTEPARLLGPLVAASTFLS